MRCEIPEIQLAGSCEELCTEVPYTLVHGPVYSVSSTDSNSLSLRVHFLLIKRMFSHNHCNDNCENKAEH